MNTISRTDRSLDGQVTLTITQREGLLLTLSLGIMDQDHTKSGLLHFDIQNLQNKLSNELGR